MYEPSVSSVVAGFEDAKINAPVPPFVASSTLPVAPKHEICVGVAVIIGNALICTGIVARAVLMQVDEGPSATW